MLGFNLPITVLISRPKNDAEALKRALEACNLGADIIVAPVIRIVPVPFVTYEGQFDAFILTSKHGVHAAVKSAACGVALCVGDATAKAARLAGLEAISAGGTSRDLMSLAQAAGFSKLLYLRGEHVHGNLEDDLNLVGLETKSKVVYRQEACDFSPQIIKDITKVRKICIPIYSARSAQILSRNLCDFEGEIIIIAISKMAAMGWSGPKPHKLVLADVPNSKAMMKAIASQLG